MNILYYTWEESVKNDIVEAMINMGNVVEVINYDIKNYLSDSDFVHFLNEKLEEKEYDYIFSIDYFPIISKVALLRKIVYISWIYDSPHNTLYSEMIYNPYNFVFSFDSFDVMKLANKDVKNIFHMPLGANVKRINTLLENTENVNSRFVNKQVAFMGSLKEDNLFDNINHISAYCKGYVDAIVKAQLKIWGYDLVEDAMETDVADEMLKYIDFNMDKEIGITQRELLLGIIREKISNVERKEILQILSGRFKVALYSNQSCKSISNIDEKGILRYEDEMPLMFANSKINLNITPRGIRSGISLRVMDVLAAGGFLITNYQPEIAEYFEDGKELVMYQSREDLLYKVQYYLEHEEERKSISIAGKRKIEKEFSYEMQLEKIFKTVQERS